MVEKCPYLTKTEVDDFIHYHILQNKYHPNFITFVWNWSSTNKLFLSNHQKDDLMRWIRKKMESLKND